MFRLFNMFGPSKAQMAFDNALRVSGVHPLLVPEPVKLTVIQLNRKLAEERDQEIAFTHAAQLIAYCILGDEEFRSINGREAADQTDQRMETAITEGNSLDAKLILLTVHSGLISPEIADRIDVEDT
ncbi:MAG: hypothetical protein JJU15_17165 [Pararhodobacter sp.]|nr:hypothetical protein [Pararhodobacter sp.]